MTSAAAGAASPAQARIVALFLVLAVVLGGGGSPNPTTELLLELAFAGSVAVWLWFRSGGPNPPAPTDRLVLLLIAVALVIPAVQLLPLPPSIWTSLPSRHDQFAALSLVGKENSWRPISLSPSRTLASLLAIVPAVGCAYAVARLDRRGRRLVVATIAVMAVVSTLLGVLQLMAGERGINLYPQFHAGWITGFQANRNAEADVLLIGFLALVAFAAPYLADADRKFPMMLDRRAALALLFALALCLLAATIMTGSRAGVALIPVAIVFALAILGSARVGRRETRAARFVLLAAMVFLAGLAVVYLAYAGHTAVWRVAQRFTDDPNVRVSIWQDAWFALGQYWPVGFGMGGFEPAMIPSERLEFLSSSIPNRAHNDFLEIGLEAGVFGYAMIVAGALACFTMAYRSWRFRPENRVNTLFAAGVLFVIALHSLVDYPRFAFMLQARNTAPARLPCPIRVCFIKPDATEPPSRGLPMKAEMLRTHGGVGRDAVGMEPIAFSDDKIAFVTDRCRGKRVLDLGCVMHDPNAVKSRYFLHRAISEVAASAIGLDLHGPGVAHMRELGYDVREGDAENFTFDEKFDVIVAGDIVEHLGNLDGFLRSADAALAEGGTIIVQSPNPWYWRNVVKSVLSTEVANNAEHTCWFCPRTWRQLVERYGFTLGAIQFDARYPRDVYMPLPRGVKYPAWSLETVRKG